MRGNKYLVMRIDGTKAGFLTASLGGCCRSANPTANTTKFSCHDFGGGHDNDNYWNSPVELLVGFCRWYSRAEENTAHMMGNRIYAASAKYRFFKVTEEGEEFLANSDLTPFEISEETFISGMLTSWEFSSVSKLFPAKLERPEQTKTKVEVVFNPKYETWCWSSDYLEADDTLCIQEILTHPQMDYEATVAHISEVFGCNYRFGGNDKYLEDKGINPIDRSTLLT